MTGIADQDSVKNIYEQLMEDGCKDSHKIELKSKIHTSPPKFKYECVNCGASAVSTSLL